VSYVAVVASALCSNLGSDTYSGGSTMGNLSPTSTQQLLPLTSATASPPSYDVAGYHRSQPTW